MRFAITYPFSSLWFRIGCYTPIIIEYHADRKHFADRKCFVDYKHFVDCKRFTDCGRGENALHFGKMAVYFL